MELYNKTELRKTSNGIGFYIFAIILTMYFVSFASSVISTTLTGSMGNIAILLIDNMASIVSMFIIGIFYCMFSRTELNNVLPLKKVNGSLLFKTVMVALAVAFISDYFTEMFVSGVSLFGIHNKVEMSYESNGIVDNILYIISIAVIPPLTEEFAFRGIILGKLRKFGDSFAILMSAVLFGLLHGNIVQIPFAFIIGIVFGFITIKTSSLIPAMITHFLINCSSVIVSIIQENNLFDKNICDIIYSAFIFIVFILGIISTILLCKDKEFFKLKKFESAPFKERVKQLFSTAGIICALALIVVETIISVLI